MNIDKAFSDNEKGFGIFNDFDDFNASIGTHDNDREEIICSEIELDETNSIKSTSYMPTNEEIQDNILINLNSGLSDYSTQVFVINEPNYSNYINTDEFDNQISSIEGNSTISAAPISLLLMTNDEKYENINDEENIIDNSYDSSYLGSETNDLYLAKGKKQKGKHRQNSHFKSDDIDPRIFFQGDIGICARKRKVKVPTRRIKVIYDDDDDEKFYYFEKARPSPLKHLKNQFKNITWDNKITLMQAFDMIKNNNGDATPSEHLSVQYLSDFFQPIIYLEPISNHTLHDILKFEDVKSYAQIIVNNFNKQERDRRNKFRAKYYGRRRASEKEYDVNTKNKILSKIFYREQKVIEQIKEVCQEHRSDELNLKSESGETIVPSSIDLTTPFIPHPQSDNATPLKDDKHVIKSTPLSNLKKRVELLKKLNINSEAPNFVSDLTSAMHEKEELIVHKNENLSNTTATGQEDSRTFSKMEDSVVGNNVGGGTSESRIKNEETITTGVRKKVKLPDGRVKFKRDKEKTVRRSKDAQTNADGFSSTNIDDIINKVASLPDESLRVIESKRLNNSRAQGKREFIGADDNLDGRNGIENSNAKDDSLTFPITHVKSGSSTLPPGSKPKKPVVNKRKPLAFSQGGPDTQPPKAPSTNDVRNLPKTSERSSLTAKVIKHFSDILADRVKSLSSGRGSNSGTLVKKTEQIAVQMEAAMRSLYPSNPKDTSDAKYKAKYRALVYNLKDPKNKVYTKLITGEVDCGSLVKMSQEEISFYRSGSAATAKSTFKILPNNAKVPYAKTNPSGTRGKTSVVSPPKSLSFTSGYVPTTGCSSILPSYRTGSPKVEKVKDGMVPKLSSYNSSSSSSLQSPNLPLDPRLKNRVNQSQTIPTTTNYEVRWSGSISCGELIQSQSAPSFEAVGRLLYDGAPNDFEEATCESLPKIISCRSRILPEIVWSKFSPQKSMLLLLEPASPPSVAYQNLFTYLSDNKRFATSDDVILGRDGDTLEIFLVPYDTTTQGLGSLESSFPKKVVANLRVGSLLVLLLYRTARPAVEPAMTEPGKVNEPSTPLLTSVIANSHLPQIPLPPPDDLKSMDVMDLFKSLNPTSLPFGDADYRILPAIGTDALKMSKDLYPQAIASSTEANSFLPDIMSVVTGIKGSISTVVNNGESEIPPAASLVPNFDDLLSKVAQSLKTLEKKQRENSEERSPENAIANNQSDKSVSLTSPLQDILSLLNVTKKN